MASESFVLLQLKKFASIPGIYISTDNPSQLKYKILKFLWLAISISSLQPVVSLQKIVCSLRVIILIVLQLKSIYTEWTDFVKSFYAFYFCVGMLGCFTQALDFSSKGKLFDKIMIRMNSNAKNCK